jgi:hypothetical protein
VPCDSSDASHQIALWFCLPIVINAALNCCSFYVYWCTVIRLSSSMVFLPFSLSMCSYQAQLHPHHSQQHLVHQQCLSYQQSSRCSSRSASLGKPDAAWKESTPPHPILHEMSWLDCMTCTACRATSSLHGLLLAAVRMGCQIILGMQSVSQLQLLLLQEQVVWVQLVAVAAAVGW